VGRDPHALVCLDYDPFVSTRHAELRRASGGGFELADLHSSNGTYLDWKRLERGVVRPLANGGLVRCGKTLLLFRKGP
jgi:pSer/pThr/pTyr-binding forkhead associated (FHA) protein